MAQRLKRWESPRKSGRNDKGKGGSARQRQRKKQFKLLEKRLKRSSKDQHNKTSDGKHSDGKQNNHGHNILDGRDSVLSRFCI